MNIVDAVSAAYVAFGAYRGRKRGFSDEAYRLLRMAIAFVAGCGLYGVVSQLIGKVLSLGGEVSGPVAFLGTVGGAWLLLRKLKRGFIAWVFAKTKPYEGLGGAVAGGVRALLIVVSIVAALSLAGKTPGGDSFAGRIVDLVLPGR